MIDPLDSTYLYLRRYIYILDIYNIYQLYNDCSMKENEYY